MEIKANSTEFQNSTAVVLLTLFAVLVEIYPEEMHHYFTTPWGVVTFLGLIIAGYLLVYTIRLPTLVSWSMVALVLVLGCWRLKAVVRTETDARLTLNVREPNGNVTCFPEGAVVSIEASGFALESHFDKTCDAIFETPHSLNGEGVRVELPRSKGYKRDYEVDVVRDSVEISLAKSDLRIETTGPQPRWDLSHFSAERFMVEGGEEPVSITAEGVVPGLSWDPSRRTLSGTPARAGSFVFYLRAEDADGAEVTMELPIHVLQLVVESDAPWAIVGNPYILPLTVLGGTGQHQIVQVSGGVPGLSLRRKPPAFSGVPMRTGSFPVSFRLEDADGATATTSFRINVVEFAPSSAVLGGSVGRFYTQDFSIQGPSGPVELSINGRVPGLTFDPRTGALTGTPTDPGSFGFSVIGRAGTGTVIRKDFHINVLVVSTSAELPDGAVGEAYSQAIVVDGGKTPLTVDATGGPPGASFDPQTRRLAGVLTAPGIFVLHIDARDAEGIRVAKDVHITVREVQRVRALFKVYVEHPESEEALELFRQLEGENLVRGPLAFTRDLQEADAVLRCIGCSGGKSYLEIALYQNTGGVLLWGTRIDNENVGGSDEHLKIDQAVKDIFDDLTSHAASISNTLKRRGNGR